MSAGQHAATQGKSLMTNQRIVALIIQWYMPQVKLLTETCSAATLVKGDSYYSF